MWLTTDIIFVSSAMVLIQHVILPWLAFKDVKAVKSHLLVMLNEMKHTSKLNSRGNSMKDISNSINNDQTFNAARWMLTSYRLAQEFPDHQISKLIMKFRSPLPLRLISRAVNVKGIYSRKFSFLISSASFVVVS